MPELPEVDAITGVVRKHAVGNAIVRIEVLRGNYFDVPKVRVGGTIVVAFSGRFPVHQVYRLGKRVIIEAQACPIPSYVVSHMMMTGYYDWEHEPWTFDYVEADREATDDDVRVRIKFRDGKVLRFHDSRLFGKIEMVDDYVQQDVPELMETPNGKPGARIITLEEFAKAILSDRRPIKAVVMDQKVLAGIGNIYANEAFNLIGLDPRLISNTINPRSIPLLLQALRLSVEHSIPKVRYDWLKVYRRERCGSCDGKILREKVAGRSTFICERCQT